MSLVTFEVEIDHGRVIPRGPEALHEKGMGLLTLLPGASAAPPRASISDFVEKWAGAFAIVESPGDDLRLEYLLGKHVK